mmetsp:Transcript_29783/g.47977  ORF Transcript_29783/g.47977 Transcript_29783/m.47977 type:complete len:218 (+) Transcript_29783:73-726(+)
MSSNRFLRCYVAVFALCQLSYAFGAYVDPATSGVSLGDAQSDTKALAMPSAVDSSGDGQVRHMFRWLVLVAFCISIFYVMSTRLRILTWPESSGKWAPMAIASAGSKAEAWSLEIESLVAAVVSAMPARIRRMWPHSGKYSGLKFSSRDDDDSLALLVKHNNEALSPSRRSSHGDIELSGSDGEAISRSDSEVLDDALGSFLASKLYAKRSNIDSLL